MSTPIVLPDLEWSEVGFRAAVGVGPELAEDPNTVEVADLWWDKNSCHIAP